MGAPHDRSVADLVAPHVHDTAQLSPRAFGGVSGHTQLPTWDWVFDEMLHSAVGGRAPVSDGLFSSFPETYGRTGELVRAAAWQGNGALQATLVRFDDAANDEISTTMLGAARYSTTATLQWFCSDDVYYGLHSDFVVGFEAEMWHLLSRVDDMVHDHVDQAHAFFQKEWAMTIRAYRVMGRTEIQGSINTPLIQAQLGDDLRWT